MKKLNVILILILLLIAYEISFCDVIKKLGYNFNISNFDKSLKLVDKIKVKENSDIELKKIMLAKIRLAEGKNALALKEVKGYLFEDYTLDAQTIKILCLADDSLAVDSEISKWYKLESEGIYRTYNSDFLRFSFALYKSGNNDEALRLSKQYYDRSDYDRRIILFELFESCYLYEQGNYEKIEVLLKDLKTSSNEKIPAKIENTRLLFWRALIYHKLENSIEAKSNYIDGIRLMKEIAKKTKVQVDITYYIYPYVYFIPSNEVTTDFSVMCEEYNNISNE